MVTDTLHLSHRASWEGIYGFALAHSRYTLLRLTQTIYFPHMVIRGATVALPRSVSISEVISTSNYIEDWVVQKGFAADMLSCPMCNSWFICYHLSASPSAETFYSSSPLYALLGKLYSTPTPWMTLEYFQVHFPTV